MGPNCSRPSRGRAHDTGGGRLRAAPTGQWYGRRPPTKKGFPMKTCLACLFAASLLLTAPAAGAEELQSVHTISVVGVGYAPIPPMANRTEADVDYNQAMINAVANGLSKAQALAEAAGARVGSIEAISESG